MAQFTPIPFELVERYDRPLPRYTSYPTVPFWRTPEAGETDAGLQNVAADEDRVSVYVHIPFCSRMCHYCGCNTTVTKRPDVIERYVKAVCAEIGAVRDRVGKKTLMQLHFGGGTPSLLPPAILETVMGHLYTAFAPHPSAEISMELDPTVTTREHYTALKGFGFNRVSLGVQDFDDDVQVAIGREQWSSITLDAFAHARAAGFESINLDLLYGLPLQTASHLERSARAVVELGADRIAIFGYAHVPWLKPHQKKLERFPLPRARERWEMFQAARKVFYEAGYEPVGFDHFAKPNDELARNTGRLNRNFQGYTAMAPMPVLAFGASAIGDLGDRFVQNDKRLSAYMQAVEHGRAATELVCIREPDDEARRELIVDLMCNLRLDARERSGLAKTILLDTLAQAPQRLAEPIEDGLVEVDANVMRVTERGRAFLRNLASVFDAYLERQTTARFSRAV